MTLKPSLVAIIFVIIKLATQTIFKSSSLELTDRKVSDPKVMLKPKFAKKDSLRSKFVKVGIGHPPAQMPMPMPDPNIKTGGVV